MSGAVNDKRYLIDNFYCQIDQLDINKVIQSPRAIQNPKAANQELEEKKDPYTPEKAVKKQSNKLSFVGSNEIDDESEQRPSERLKTENISDCEEFEALRDANSQQTNLAVPPKPIRERDGEDSEEDYSFVLNKSGREGNQPRQNKKHSKSQTLDLEQRHANS